MTYPLITKTTLAYITGQTVDEWHKRTGGSTTNIRCQVTIASSIIKVGVEFMRVEGNLLTSGAATIAVDSPLTIFGRTYKVVKIDELVNALNGQVEQKKVYFV